MNSWLRVNRAALLDWRANQTPLEALGAGAKHDVHNWLVGQPKAGPAGSEFNEGYGSMTAATPAYDRTTIALHWATAGLVAMLWISGQTADWIPDGLVNTSYWSVHVVGGFALAIVFAWRLVWRRTSGRRLPAADAGAVHVLAKATHYFLYGLLLTVVTLGVTNAFVRGYNLFDLVSLPQVGDLAWREQITQWHGLAANILLGLAFFHATAALVHHYGWRDGVLRRMLPSR